MRYPLGQPVTIPITVRDRTGALVDASTLTIVAKVRNADGTQTTTGTYATPTHDSTGTYHQDIPVTDLTTLGHYQWTATSTGTGAGVAVGDFDVFDPFEPAVLPLADAKDHLNIPQANTASDSEIQLWVSVIEAHLESMTGGPILNTTVVERAELDMTCTVLQLQQRPVVSVTSVVPVATGLASDISAGLDIDTGAGIVRTKPGFTFSSGFSTAVTVTYVAGWGAVIPVTFNRVAAIVLAQLWETQHGPAARPSMGGDMTGVISYGFESPLVIELMNGTLNGIPFRTAAFA